MNIRSAVLSDLPAVLALERASPTAAHWSEAEYRLIFDAGALPRTLLVAETAFTVGFIVVRTAGTDWEIENVVVHPQHRGRGLGLALVSAVIAQARAAAIQSVVLEVRTSNAAARALYARAGFAQVGVRSRYYSHPEEDAVLYRWVPCAASRPSG